ncbi:metalloproteinase inhibitor 1-like [Lissotriton helveticus]
MTVVATAVKAEAPGCCRNLPPSRTMSEVVQQLTFRKSMDLKKVIFLVAGLLFLEISSPVKACTCLLSVLQTSYCDADLVVLQVKFLEPSQKTGANSTDVVKGFKVQIIKVLKGAQTLKSQTFIDSMSGTTCEYNHDPNGFKVEYLISASIENGLLRASGCSDSMRWSALSSKQIQGVKGAYLEGCHCKIVTCYSQPCPSQPKTCIFEQYEGGDAENQTKNQVCVTKTSDECVWKNIK